MAALEFFHQLFDGVQSPDGKPLYLCLVYIKDKKANQAFFEWPGQAQDAVTFAARMDKAGYDVYFCAHLLTTTERKKPFAGPVHCLWVDGDDGADLNLGPTPSVVVESSPGHKHAYYRLNRAIEPQRAEQLNKRLGRMVGADKSGYDLSQLLRVPGTRNHKPERAAANGGQPPEVAILAEGTAKEYDPEELERALPELPPPPPRVEINHDEPPVKLPSYAEDLWYGRVTKKKSDGTVDRSKTLYTLACELSRAGLAASRIVQEIANRDNALFEEPKTKDREDPMKWYENTVAAAVAAVNAQTTKAAAGVAAASAVQASPKPRKRSFSEFDANPAPAPQWLVERLFLENQIGLICGPPYAGKSLFAMDVGISIASRTSVVNHPQLWPYEQRGVAYIYAEQGEQQWERCAFAIARYKGLKSSDIPFHLVSGYELNLTKPDERSEFIETLKRDNIRVCIFDPLAVVFKCEDENAASKVIEAARLPLQHFVREGIVPIAVHHATKDAARYEPDTADDLVRGSNDIIAMTGSIVGVWRSKKKKECIKVLAQGRGPVVRPSRLKREYTASWPLKFGDWAPAEEVGEGVPVLVYDGEWETEDKKQQDREIDDLPDKFRTRDAMDAWETKESTTRYRLRQMEKKGFIKSVREGRRPSDWTWVKCSPAPSADAEEEDEE